MNTSVFFKICLLTIVVIILNSCGNSDEEADPCANGPEISIAEKVSTTTGNASGSFTAAASEGQAPYQYSLDGGTFQASATFSGLSAETYTVTVKDANDCIDQTEVIITSVPEVSFASQVKPIIDTNCQVSGCHGNNASLPSFATYTQVKANANNIKTKTSTKVMPPTGPLSDNNIKLISDWVDQGAPNN
jgi:hypothetical protein